MNDTMKTKDILKTLRKARGYTNAKDFCEDAGISFNTYQNYEAGSRVPTVEILVKIANFYGVTTDYLLGRDSQKSNELTPTQREEIATQKWLSLDKEKRDALLQMMETCIKTFEAAESNHKK